LIGERGHGLPSLLRKAGGGKPARAGNAGDAAAKKRPAEALFAALRPHVSCPRTCSRTPTPSEARGHALIKLNKIIIKLL